MNCTTHKRSTSRNVNSHGRLRIIGDITTPAVITIRLDHQNHQAAVLYSNWEEITIIISSLCVKNRRCNIVCRQNYWISFGLEFSRLRRSSSNLGIDLFLHSFMCSSVLIKWTITTTMRASELFIFFGGFLKLCWQPLRMPVIKIRSL